VISDLNSIDSIKPEDNKSSTNLDSKRSEKGASTQELDQDMSNYDINSSKYSHL
jgi:hypothetical protein